MKLNRIIFVGLIILLASSSCKTIEEPDLILTNKSKLLTYTPPTNLGYLSLYRKSTFETGNFCDPLNDGICLVKRNDAFTDDDNNICYYGLADNELQISIPKYINSNPSLFNDLYNELSVSNFFHVIDTLVIWDDETLSSLNLNAPVSIAPNSYPIANENGNISLSLPLSHANLTPGIVAYISLTDSITCELESMRLTNYYVGFLGESTTPCAILRQMTDTSITLFFPFQLNIFEAADFLRLLISDDAVSLHNNICISNADAQTLLGTHTPVCLKSGTYHIIVSSDGIFVDLPRISD